jgi:DNA-binding transcriptional MerR regulator
MEVASRIPEKIFFRIGEVCELIKVQPHVLRYWESEFPMLAPQKNRAGQRVYRRKDVEMVMRIRDLLYEEKFTIAGAKKKLQDEQRTTSSRSKITTRSAPPPETPARETASHEEQLEDPDALLELAESSETGILPGFETPPPSPASQPVQPQLHGTLRGLKRDLEDLLTLLDSDASISR